LNGAGTSGFFEQANGAGHCLAKLNLPAAAIVEALDTYDAFIAEEVRGLIGKDRTEMQTARQQLLFCIILALNEAYYRVREIETHTFHEIFRIELEARNTDVLYRRFLEVLADAFGAQAGHLFLRDTEHNRWTLKASSAKGISRHAKLHIANSKRLQDKLASARTLTRVSASDCLDRGWVRRYRSAWSFPMARDGSLTGVLQFAFDRNAEWLPRDEELINAAVERCLIAANRSRLIEDLAIREEQIRQLAERMLHVEEMERRRMSRELHDDAGQSLVTIRLQMEMIEMSLPPGSDEVATRLAEVRDVTEKTILDMRRLIADLSPVVLEQFGLEAAVRQLVKRLQSVRSCTVHLDTSGLDRLPSKLQIIIYRIVQECCTNIGKHSAASNVNISISSADGVLSLEVRDNGRGFHVEEALKKADSFGLAGIRERVALLGGTFQVVSRMSKGAQSSKKRHGTEVRIELPLTAERS
jgi:signal transduction histidine kinase